MFRRFATSPLALAALVTLANMAKPATVDDTAYLLYARHIATAPADPYGFDVFWWDRPEPAMNVLCPPVVPYWLAVGVALFGVSVPLLKLWLFPFVWLLAWALRALLVRVARGSEPFAFPVLMLSPAVLPTVNLMLDVPAVALALAAVELFARASGKPAPAGRAGTLIPSASFKGQPCRSAGGTYLRIALAGLVAALAMQAKYTGFVAPAVIAWYGLTHRQFGRAAVAVGVCAALFVGWEQWLVERYGESHFWLHARSAAEPPEGENRVLAFAKDKADNFLPLAGQVGCLAVGVGFLAGSVLRVPPKVIRGVAVVWCAGFLLLATLPRHQTMIGDKFSTTAAFWQVSGVAWYLANAAAGCVLLYRVKKGLGIRLRAGSWFVVGWLVIEVVAAMVLTPFPAARRVIGVTLVMGLVAARAAIRIARCKPGRRPPQWVLALGITVGVVVAAIDTLDAYPEKVCAQRAAEFTRDRPPDGTVWYVGHWGFQHYCEAAGMKPLIANETVARDGDLVVLPAYPDAPGFHRPYPGFPIRHPPPWTANVVAVIEWDDWLSAKTVPNFYGGLEPVAGRDYSRLRVVVYRLRTDWLMRY